MANTAMFEVLFFVYKPAKPLLRSNLLSLSLNPQHPQFGEGALSCATQMTPPPKNARPASEGTSAHSRHRRPSQPHRLQLRSLFSSRRFLLFNRKVRHALTVVVGIRGGPAYWCTSPVTAVLHVALTRRWRAAARRCRWPRRRGDRRARRGQASLFDRISIFALGSCR